MCVQKGITCCGSLRGGSWGMRTLQVLQPPKPQPMRHFFSLSLLYAEWLLEDAIHLHIFKSTAQTPYTLRFPVACTVPQLPPLTLPGCVHLITLSSTQHIKTKSITSFPTTNLLVEMLSLFLLSSNVQFLGLFLDLLPYCTSFSIN